MPVSSVRLTQDRAGVSQSLGLLADLGGNWRGQGFNLIARPNHEGGQPLYLQLNQTRETLDIDAIGSSIPNRGFGQDDIELFGLTYLQRISDAPTQGALHIEPGIWITQPETSYPDEDPPAGGEIVARMATIPHGNSVLAQGAATRFNGPPVLADGTTNYNGSVFPSFNSTPFPIIPPGSPAINAANSSERLTAADSHPPVPPFDEYDLTVAAGAGNPRTPFGTTEPPLPTEIDGVPMQEVINDPIKLLQAKVRQQHDTGHHFEGVALNISTQRTIGFLTQQDQPQGSSTDVTVTDGAGGIENILFLEGGEPAGPLGPNALTSLVYATFWIEKVTPPHGYPFMQLQYAQMTILNFGILGAPAGAPILGWPHISVATLNKTFA